jgi:hypothetical protein
MQANLSLFVDCGVDVEIRGNVKSPPFNSARASMEVERQREFLEQSLGVATSSLNPHA